MFKHTNHFRLIILALVLSLIGQACGAPSTDTSTVTGNFPTEPLTLTIWRPFNEVTAYEEAVRTYKQQHPNVSFVYNTVDAKTLEEYYAKVIEGLASGNGPDIISIYNDQIPRFKDKLVNMPDTFFGGADLVASLSAQYAPAVTTDVVQSGKVYGIPFSTDTLALYWNRSVFQQALKDYSVASANINYDLLTRAPADWNEVVEATKLLTKRNGAEIQQSAIALGTTRNIPKMEDILAAIMLQKSVQMVSADRSEATFHLPSSDNTTDYPTVRVLEFLNGFTDPQSEYYTWNASQPDAVEAFIQGKTAMMIHYQRIQPYLSQRNPSLSYAVGFFPQLANAKFIVDYASYPVETVTTNSKYPQVAWDFLAHMSNNYTSAYAGALGYRTAAKQQVGATTTVSQRINQGTPFKFQVATARSWYKGEDPAATDQIFKNMLDRVTQDHQAARDSMLRAASEFTQLLKGQLTSS